jgi:hypothetical protein
MQRDFLSIGGSLTAVLAVAVIEGAWQARAPLPVVIGELVGAVLAGRPVVAGGLGPEWSVSSRVFAYDPLADEWKSLPDLPVPLNHHAAAVVDGVLYVMGGAVNFGLGMVERAEVYALLPEATAWEERAPMPEARWGHGAAEMGGKVFVAGGRRAEDKALLIYDPASDRWEIGPDLPTPRDHLGVVALDNLLYTVGGRVGSQNVATVEIFDSETDTWMEGPPLPTPGAVWRLPS